MPLVLVLSQLALAQELAGDRLPVPSASLAAESGPGALWVNPANLAYDPDPRYGLFYAAPKLSSGAGRPSAVGFTAGAGGLGVGVHTLSLPDERTAWSIDYATSLELPERLAVGWRIGWHLTPEAANWVAYDFGASWRPLPWLGMGVVAWNAGSADPAGRAKAVTGGGLALRPLEDLVVLGLDGLVTADPIEPLRTLRATARLRPVEGLYLRGHWDTDGQVGVGLEVYFDGVGAGASGLVSGGAPGAVGWIGTDEPGESLVRSGRRVPSLSLYETPEYQPSAGLFAEAGPSWLDTLELLRRLEEDRGVRGLVLSVGDLSLPWARWQELRDRIEAMEADGRPVLVYLHGSPSNAAYYAASAASRVALHPAGSVELYGLAAELTFFRGTFDLLGIEPQFVRRSEYKSAVEANTRTEPSQPSLEQTGELLDGLFDEMVRGIADGRGVTEDEVRAWIDDGPFTAREAKERGLVDVLSYPDALDGELEGLHDGPVLVPQLDETPQSHSAWESPAQIAVIYVEGAIVSGPSSSGGLLGPRTAGSWTVADQLERARNDPQVRAVVLRVDSPGGSAFASDEIWHAVERVKQDGKPVVVSMGGVAASGGYYVSAGADAIWAEPTTITGSIGVYGGKLAAGGLLDRVGVSTTTLTRGRNSTIYSGTSTWDEGQRDRMQAMVDDTYRQFKERVAEGRGMSAEEVEEVARGRVWTGIDAEARGLVDQLGGLQEALSDARERAGLPPNREVALVSYAPGGALIEALGPGLVRSLGRVPALRGLAAPLPRPLRRAYDPLLVYTLHPEETVWMMDPWVLEVR